MARKNLIGISQTPLDETSAVQSGDRPLAGKVAPMRTTSPVGGITRTLGNITQKMERAQDLEKQLAEGQTIVELDVSVIDGSFVQDRLELDRAELAVLVDQIREHGQQVPILVRPNPESPGRYQVAYGHRRLAAVRELGGRIKAVVRTLSDQQLVISQGQENNARANLSYIERALFAAKLEDRGFGRDTLMSSLGVDKAALSKMISVAKGVPPDIVRAIGPAPEVGRRRWMELIELLGPQQNEHLLNKLSADNLKLLTSYERFQFALKELKSWGRESKPRNIAQTIADLPGRVSSTKSETKFAFDVRKAPGFDEFVKNKLSSLFAEYLEQSGER